MPTIKEVLIAARKKIEKPENWTQGTGAKDIEGRYADADSPEAVCWCSMGALYAVTASMPGTYYNQAYEALRDVINDSIAMFNDTHSHADVIEIFDKAIANAH